MFSDENLGASATWSTFTGFVINVQGSVVAAPNGNGNGTHISVPAPGVLALLGSGLLALGLGRRRRH